eukprot:UN22806
MESKVGDIKNLSRSKKNLFILKSRNSYSPKEGFVQARANSCFDMAKMSVFGLERILSFWRRSKILDVPNCDEQGGDCLSLCHPSEMGANERESCVEEVGGDCLSLRHPDRMGANTYESPMTPSDSYEDGLPSAG